MDELYLDNIDEFVNDHNKIVTYKWLSLTLGVHVNVAKQMLYHYLDHKRKESSAQLHATYLVSGKLVENGQTSHRVSVVREEQLEDIKSKMNVTVSVHVYSVQKAGLKDSGPLYSVDYDAVKNNLKNCSRYSAIRCAGAVPMSSAEVQQAREMERAVVPEPQNAKTAMNGHASVASKPSTKPPKGIMGMFASKPAPKNEDAGKEIKLEPKESAAVVDAPKTKPAAKTNPMAKFFGNQAAKRPEKTVKEEEAAPSSSSVEQRASSSRAEEIQEAVPVEQPREAKKESRSKTKRVEDSDSEEEKMEKKKRRRIKKPEPDSSDDEVIPDSPQRHEAREPLPRSEGEEMTSASRPQQESSGIKTRKRRRVLKSRTFVDEEGCIVTEKGYESESYSETEDDVQAARSAPRDPIPAKIPASRKEDEKPTKSQKKAAASANKGTKQASIMGFFQKK